VHIWYCVCFVARSAARGLLLLLGIFVGEFKGNFENLIGRQFEKKMVEIRISMCFKHLFLDAFNSEEEEDRLEFINKR